MLRCRFGGVHRHQGYVRFDIQQGRGPRDHRAKRRRQNVDAERDQRILSIRRMANDHGFAGETRTQMRPYECRGLRASHAPFRTWRCLRGMSTLDNIMSGRTLKMHQNFSWPRCCDYGPARDAGRGRAPRTGRGNHRFSRDPAYQANTGRHVCHTVCRSGLNWPARWPWSRNCCCLMSRWQA